MQAFYADQLSRQASAPGGVFSEANEGADAYSPRAYPAESAITFWSAWLTTGDNAYRLAAERQIEYARSLENKDHLISFAGYVERNAQSRLVLGYFIAYRMTGEVAYLNDADDAMAALLSLQRVAWQYGGNFYQLYYYTYEPVPPYAPVSWPGLNPNQDASMGLAMTLLYHEPGSRLKGDANLKVQALEHLDAIGALQTADGRLPNAEVRMNEFDTMYGGVTLFQLYWANTYWQESRYNEVLRKSLPWLDQYTRDGLVLRTYPETYLGPPRNPRDLWFRLPVLWTYGGDLRAWNTSMDEIWDKWPTFADHPGGWTDSTCLLSLMGVQEQ